MAGLSATYIDATCFSLVGDVTLTFVVGRRVKANCGVDGYKFGTIESSSFGGGITTVCLTATSDDLTSNLTEVWYGIVGGGAYDQSMPVHTHDGSEGSGGLVDTGCCVGVYYEGIAVDGGEFDNLNFEGDNISIDSTSSVSNAVDIQVIFGQEYDYNSSDGESSTSSDTPQEKVSLTTGNLPSGTYHIEWGYEFSVDDDKDSEFNARVQIDDTTTIAAQGDPTGTPWKIDNDVWVAQSGFYDAALSGIIDIDIDYWDTGTTGVNIRRARIAIWRVA